MSTSKTFGRYQLIAEIGRGGMAEVYLAVLRASTFSKLVVIKKLREHLAGDAEFASMLMDEARIAGLLNHPNLVQTMEVGDENGELYLVMEYLDGQPLHRIIRRGEDSFPLMMHLSVLLEVLGGMDYAHNLTDLDGTPINIVHRDVTPHNIFVTYQGVTKVVDFGIAKAVGRMSETRHGVVKGKAAYMAPEQTMGAHVDRRADIFAIGVMLYEAVTRRRMWKGLSELDAISALVEGKIPNSPKAFNPECDDELERICKRALAHSPADRYESAAAMERDLRAYLLTKDRPTSQEIGAYVGRLFSDKRAMVNKVIEDELARLRAAGPTSKRIPSGAQSSAIPLISSGSTGAITGNSSSTSSIVAPTPPPKPAAKVPVEPEPAQPTEPREREAPRRRSSRVPPPAKKSDLGWTIGLIGGALALAIATAGLTVFAFRPAEQGPDNQVPAETTSASTKPITVTLRATPLETRFSIDDGPLLENPYSGQFPRDLREHSIRAVAPGYPAKQERVVFGDDLSIRFTLSQSGR